MYPIESKLIILYIKFMEHADQNLGIPLPELKKPPIDTLPRVNISELTKPESGIELGRGRHHIVYTVTHQERLVAFRLLHHPDSAQISMAEVNTLNRFVADLPAINAECNNIDLNLVFEAPRQIAIVVNDDNQYLGSLSEIYQPLQEIISFDTRGGIDWGIYHGIKLVLSRWQELSQCSSIAEATQKLHNYQEKDNTDSQEARDKVPILSAQKRQMDEDYIRKKKSLSRSRTHAQKPQTISRLLEEESKLEADYLSQIATLGLDQFENTVKTTDFFNDFAEMVSKDIAKDQPTSIADLVALEKKRLYLYQYDYDSTTTRIRIANGLKIIAQRGYQHDDEGEGNMLGYYESNPEGKGKLHLCLFDFMTIG